MRRFLEVVTSERSERCPTWRAWQVGVVTGLAVASVGCGGDTSTEDPGGSGGLASGGGGTGGVAPAGGAPTTGGYPAIGGTLYGIPYETDCADGINNDPSMDDDVDCDDADCANSPSCIAMPPYGIPMEYEFDCADGINNDPSMDDDIDCADSDCLGDPVCPAFLYAAPM